MNKTSNNKLFRFLKTIGFLSLLVGLFAGYSFVSADNSPDEFVQVTIDGDEATWQADMSFSPHAENSAQYHNKFRHNLRKRGIYRTNYLKRTISSRVAVSSPDYTTPAVAISGYRWLYNRPPYYIHLFRYALF